MQAWSQMREMSERGTAKSRAGPLDSNKRASYHPFGLVRKVGMLIVGHKAEPLLFAPLNIRHDGRRLLLLLIEKTQGVVEWIGRRWWGRWLIRHGCWN